MMQAVTQGVAGLNHQEPALPEAEQSSVAKHVCLHFRIPFWTVWGQSLVVCGDGKVLGNWDPLQGLRMSCQHIGNEL
eukprot:scaffold299221_cov43-Prasinocladus_malaysianus.AAC.1